MPKIKKREAIMDDTPNLEIKKLKADKRQNETKLWYHKNQPQKLEYEEINELIKKYVAENQRKPTDIDDDCKPERIESAIFLSVIVRFQPVGRSPPLFA